MTIDYKCYIKNLILLIYLCSINKLTYTRGTTLYQIKRSMGVKTEHTFNAKFQKSVHFFMNSFIFKTEISLDLGVDYLMISSLHNLLIR